MVKFDLKAIPFLSKDDFRVLTAVETGMRNHEIVPCKLVGVLSSLRSGTGKVLNDLTHKGLICYERGKRYDGYRLTSLGYDYLALRVLRDRKVIDRIGSQIGVGKEASVYIAGNSTNDEVYVLKVHRLGRSFKAVHNKRDYHRSKVSNWLYLSRLAAKREHSFMKILYDRGFNIPEPVEINRHCILMKWIDGTLLNNLSSEDEIDHKKLLDQLLNMIFELANKYGVVHGDFNEFNLLIHNETNEPYLIDFPQMVSTDHQLAEEYFNRDVNCIVSFFEKRFNCLPDELLTFESIISEESQNIARDVDGKDSHANEILNRYLEDNLQLSENFKAKLILNDENQEDDDHKFSKWIDLSRELNNLNESKGINLKQTDNLNENENDNEIESQQERESTIEIEKITEKPTDNCSIDDQKFSNNDQKFSNNDQKFSNNNQSKEDVSQRHTTTNDCSINDKTDCMSTFSYSASRIGGASSVASTFMPQEIRARLKKEKDRVAKRQSIKESFKKIKGDASSVGRQRKTNKQNIKEDNTIFEWLD